MNYYTKEDIIKLAKIRHETTHERSKGRTKEPVGEPMTEECYDDYAQTILKLASIITNGDNDSMSGETLISRFCLTRKDDKIPREADKG